MNDDTATTLFGLPGVRVVEVDTEPDGSTTVYVQTAHPDAAVCPGCGIRAGRCKQLAVARPRDLRYGGRRIRLVWWKRRWYCRTPTCRRHSFTESLPQLPARRRLSQRLRDELAEQVIASPRSVAEVAATAGVSWQTVHNAFAEAADAVLPDEPPPVAHLGIDEIRRGRPRFATDPATGERTQVADRWHAGFTDLAGVHGLLGQVEGRSAADIAGWLSARTPAWRAAVATVSIDMCSAFRAAVRQALPGAALCVDAFHLVQAANKMVTSVRWRIVRAKYGRRGRSGDPEYGIKRLLLRNLEDRSEDQLAKLWNTMADDPALADLHAAWIAKEMLRDLLALRITRSHTSPAPSRVRHHWSTLLDWCARHDHVPELVTFATTLDAWRQEIINAVLTGASNAGSEGINRIQKLDARTAFGYRNPSNQRRRARIAARRSTTPSRTVKHRQRLWVTGPQPKPS